jgi:hypothetical protein
MNAGIWDYDHKDGNRGNNKASNCQVLCPTCHAKKSRGLPTRDTYPRIIKHIPYLIAPCPVIAMCRDKRKFRLLFLEGSEKYFFMTAPAGPFLNDEGDGRIK